MSAASPIRIGIVGLGAAGRAFLPAIKKHSGFQLVAVAEPVQEARDSVAAEMNAAGYADIQAMIAGTALDAIYIATPTELHSDHVKIAFAANKHVLSEKPMAVELTAARRDDRRRRPRRRGSPGRPCPWLRSSDPTHARNHCQRPARPGADDPHLELHRLDVPPAASRRTRCRKGGGVTFRQGSHQFDIIRLLGGGLVQSVRAATFNWDPGRNSIGAHTSFMHFADGTAATATYNGYGYFSTMELCGDVTEWGFIEPIERRQAVVRASAGRTAADELEAKRKRAKGAIPADAPFQPTFGLTLVSCERGDIRQSPRGLYLYSADGREEIVLPADRSPRDLVLDEFHDAITGRRPPIHDGRWGLANLEVCVAAIESAATGREVTLKHQIAAPR